MARTVSLLFIALTCGASFSMAPPTAPPTPPAQERPGIETPAPERPAPSALIDRYIEAIGGREAWLKEQSQTISWRLELSAERDGRAAPEEASGTLIVRKKAPDRMHSVMTIPGLGESKQGFDGTNGWSIDQNGVARLLEGAELAERRREAHFDRELRMAEFYPTMENLGERRLDGERCWLVHMSAANGTRAQAWFSIDSGLLVGFARRLPLQGSEIPVIQRLKEYRSVGDRRVPGRIEQTVGGTTQVMILEGIDGACIDDEAFTLPPTLKPA